MSGGGSGFRVQGSGGRWGRVALGGILVVALGLRCAAGRGELWLDEAWSVLLARGCKSVLDVFRGGSLVDNNHPLNTLWLYAAGYLKHYQVYRLPAVVAGVGAVWVAWRIGKRRGVWAGLGAAMAVAVSYPSVQYSSEARGYAMAVFFALACLDVLWDEKQGRWGAVWYGVFAVLGLLSHLTFLQFMLGAGVYTLVRSGYDVGETLRWHGGPAVAAVGMYFGFIRKITIAGGPAADVGRVVRDTAAVFAGGEGWVAAVLFAAVVVFALVRLVRRRDGRVVFYLAMMVSPFVLLGLKTFLLGRAEVVYIRYFLIPATVLLVLAGEEIGAWASGESDASPRPEVPREYRRDDGLGAAGAPGGRAIVRLGVGVVVMAAFVVANCVQVGRLIAVGRGSPMSALIYVAENSPKTDDTVAAVFPEETWPEAHDTRLARLIEFYEPYLPKGAGVYQLKANSRMAPQWLLVSTASGEVTPELRFHGCRYVLRRVFRHYGLSGWNWAVYQLAAG